MTQQKKTPLLLSWHKEFEQDKEIIDEQHRAILASINSIYYLFLKGEDNNLIKHLMMLYSQLQMHFKTELLILRQHESPLVSDYEHQAEALLTSLLDICDVKNLDHQTQALFEQFKKWWQAHLQLHQQITPYLFKWDGDFCRVVA
ncbi:chemotaxis protein [Methylophaga sp. OBS1]|jgi:hemerythrin|uniref:chemotaxis protein n=1 Tax=Methylophaga sp. OBS1 TaxID=2991933 RepID=UPI00224E69DF|nr:chemotaxis protein [Methylophaga sp. OBS1]MCX4191407.1 chemotaxis protein [Methylophaga sp. OBS1]MCX4191647.1 chemotaxis protein [Methylophaga sp. OBS1]